MMRWSSQDLYNKTQDCTRHMMLAGRTHYNAMVCIMDYYMTTPERGFIPKPHGNWDGISPYYKFEVLIKTDSDHSKFPGMKRSITGSVAEWSAHNI